VSYPSEAHMTPLRSMLYGLAGICVALGPAVLGASAQQPAHEFTPQVGQPGKDVIWVPTPQSLVDRMLQMAKVTPSDYVVDLGSGDGRTVISAAKIGAKAHGIEYNPQMVELSKRNADKAGVSEKATFANADIFESDFSKATVVTLFLLPNLNIKVRPILLDMAPGTRVVSNSFDMGDWKADETAHVTGDCTGYCRAYLWIVPAKVAGTWKFGPGELSIEQQYQNFTGKLATGNVIAPITDGKLDGDKISFSAGGTRYAGQVKSGSMEGASVTGGIETRWRATRR
jgi:SAM-dependent methyltransferase